MAYKNPDQAREYRNKWQKENKEKRQQSAKKYYDKRKQDPEFKVLHASRYKTWREANPEGNRERNRKYRNAKPEQFAVYEIRKRYKVSLEEAAILLERRKKGCEVCNSQTKAHIDHDHATGKVRGILCHGCNVTLGHAFDNPVTLRALAVYLER